MEGMWSAIPLRWEWENKKDRPMRRRKMPFIHLQSMFPFLHCGLLAQSLHYSCTFSQQFRVSEPSHSLSHLEFTGRTPWSRYRGKAGFRGSIFQMWTWVSKMWSGLLAIILLTGDKAEALSQDAHALPTRHSIGVCLIVFTNLTMHTSACYWTCLSYQFKSVAYLLIWHLLSIYFIICLICW